MSRVILTLLQDQQGIDGVFIVSPCPSGFDDHGVEVLPILSKDIGDKPSIAISLIGLHVDIVAEGEALDEPGRLRTEPLMHLWRVNSLEPDVLGSAIMAYNDRIAVNDTDHRTIELLRDRRGRPLWEPVPE